MSKPMFKFLTHLPIIGVGIKAYLTSYLSIINSTAFKMDNYDRYIKIQNSINNFAIKNPNTALTNSVIEQLLN